MILVLILYIIYIYMPELPQQSNIAIARATPAILYIIHGRRPTSQCASAHLFLNKHWRSTQHAHSTWLQSSPSNCLLRRRLCNMSAPPRACIRRQCQRFSACKYRRRIVYTNFTHRQILTFLAFLVYLPNTMPLFSTKPRNAFSTASPFLACSLQWRTTVYCIQLSLSQVNLWEARHPLSLFQVASEVIIVAALWVSSKWQPSESLPSGSPLSLVQSGSPLSLFHAKTHSKIGNAPRRKIDNSTRNKCAIVNMSPKMATDKLLLRSHNLLLRNHQMLLRSHNLLLRSHGLVDNCIN